ncbi:MAG: M12 family metallo-peptidase, partial [Flavobacteriales bacterium]|nr:M12 family metallo-peptidase [Flavobacteriales bacterium]
MIRSLLTAVCALTCSGLTFGQGVNFTNSPEPRSENRRIVPAEYRTVSTDFESLKAYLSQAPNANNTSVRNSNFTIEIPTPGGASALFKIVASSVMSPALQEKFPNIKTFKGQGTGEFRAATIRLDFTEKGFHAQVLQAGNSFYIDPYAEGDLNTYIVYTREAFYAQTDKVMPECEPRENSATGPPQPEDRRITDPDNRGQRPMRETPFLQSASRTSNGTQLRTYDLALACTGEYASYHGGTTSGAMSAMTTTMNRVNGVFERDLSLEMIMVDDNDDLIFLNSSTDPYSNGNGGAMLSQNQEACDDEIGSSNYDIGHVFSTGGGGVAYLASVCNSSIKAGGVSGQFNPVGDPFDIDYVSHEMGHQWGARHTQNNSCNRTASAAYEPGSASTIMGYAGICPPNIQSNSDDHFHNHSFNEMYSFSVNGSGNTCATTSSTGNTPPDVTLISGGFYIPVETPFELTADATDSDGDELTYCWEQYDLGPATAASDNNLTDPSGNAPIFRSFSPESSPTRVFPRITDLVNNTTIIGEHLPTYSRDLTFRCT